MTEQKIIELLTALDPKHETVSRWRVQHGEDWDGDPSTTVWVIVYDPEIPYAVTSKLRERVKETIYEHVPMTERWVHVRFQAEPELAEMEADEFTD